MGKVDFAKMKKVMMSTADCVQKEVIYCAVSRRVVSMDFVR